MPTEKKKADLLPRFLAALVDGIIGSVPIVIPVIGGLVGAAYILTKDAVMYEVTKDDQWKNKSIGKKLFKIEVNADQADTVDWITSIKRNVSLSLGSIIGIIPFIGWILGPVVAFGIFIIELVLMLSSPEGKRLGDRIAETTVVTEQSTEQHREAV